MCGNWLSGNSKLEHVTLEKKGTAQPVVLQEREREREREFIGANIKKFHTN